MTTGSSCRRSNRRQPFSIARPAPSPLEDAGVVCRSCISRTPAAPSREALAFQFLGALTVIAAALLDPLQAAIGIGGLVGVVLIDAGVHPRLASAFLGIFRIDGGGEYRGSGGCGRRRGGSGFLLRLGFRGFRRWGRGTRRGSRRSGGCRGGVRSALGFAEIV